jgi:NADPH:quinone reductase-like Zn-dependent oxidoreductase
MPMKAAVLRALGKPPRFEEFPDPKPSQGEVIVHVKAASLKNIDKMMASGSHYDSHRQLPVVCGTDGVGILDDGTRVFCGGSRPPYGMMAERTVLSRQPHHLRALPRACETEGRGALLGHSTSEGRQDRADDGARLNVDINGELTWNQH